MMKKEFITLIAVLIAILIFDSTILGCAQNKGDTENTPVTADKITTNKKKDKNSTEIIFFTLIN